MPLEFVAKNGLISLGNVQVTSSVTATGFTGSFYGTASQAITASYWNSSSVATILNNKQFNIATGSTVPVTSSWAFSVVNPTLATGSTYPITASWANNSISTSYWDS